MKFFFMASWRNKFDQSLLPVRFISLQFVRNNLMKLRGHPRICTILANENVLNVKKMN
jgi:hypothetical protein